MNTLPIYRETVIEVDLDKIAYNMEQIRAMVGKDVKIAAVVKANGYGHGAVGIAPAIMEHGGDLLCVATLTEAIELKEAYPRYPVLIMGLTPTEYFPAVLDYNILQTIDTLAQAKALAALARERGATAGIHIKYDTGFHRIGFPDAPKSYTAIEEISRMEGLKIEGIFSHLVLLDDESNRQQYEAFSRAVRTLKERGVALPCCHLADSIASVDYPRYRMDMIRAGAIIYGLKGFHKGSLDVRQALTFKTKINHITEIKAGEGVSYDFVWRSDRDTRIGTLPFGYADGYPRNLRGKAMVTVRGKQVPVVGVLCMDQCMIDLGDVPKAQIGDEVIIYGDGTGNTLDIQAVSVLAETNKNDIVARLTARPPRIYRKDGKIAEIRTMIGRKSI
ncbi:MAG: alanine racemase [Lachnospiraceae bacterium]|nr:alanine racemase [Lachnospiraceae bacterium]